MLKKLFVTLVFSCTLFLVQAQVRPTIFAGLQQTKALYTIRDSKQSVNYKTGFILGAGIKVPFDAQLYFFPAIYYNRKGYMVTFKDRAAPPSELALNNNVTVQSIEVAPLFHIDLSTKSSHLFLRFGPSVDFIFSGKEVFDTAANGAQPVSRKMPFSFTNYGRVTATANAHLGYENVKGFMIFAYYSYGIGSMNNADAGPHILHRAVGLSIGWAFGYNPNLIDTRVKE